MQRLVDGDPHVATEIRSKVREAVVSAAGEAPPTAALRAYVLRFTSREVSPGRGPLPSSASHRWAVRTMVSMSECGAVSPSRRCARAPSAISTRRIRPPQDGRQHHGPSLIPILSRGFTTREWVDAIDFSTLRKLPAEYVSDELRKRLGDTVWAVQLRDRRYMLLMLEFQSRADPMMALRILVYTGLLYQEIVRNDAPVLDARRRLPVVLPVVLYSGTTPWRAAREFAELVQPVEPALGSSRPSQRYQVLDEHHVAEEDLPEANLVTAVIRLERIESPSDLVGVVELLREWLRRSEDKELRRAFTDWVRRIAGRLVPGGQKLAAGMTLEEMRMTTVVERVSEWPKQWVREGLEQGRAEERILLERMTALRFGTDTAQRLSAVLAEIADPERLAEVGEWLVRCETAEAFLARAERVRAAGEEGHRN